MPTTVCPVIMAMSPTVTLICVQQSVNVNQENPILRENSGGSFGSGGVQGLWVVVTILAAYALGIRSWFHVRFGGRR